MAAVSAVEVLEAAGALEEEGKKNKEERIKNKE